MFIGLLLDLLEVTKRKKKYIIFSFLRIMSVFELNNWFTLCADPFLQSIELVDLRAVSAVGCLVHDSFLTDFEPCRL